MNKVVLIGNLTKDIELNTTSSGISVARFTLAVSRKFTNAEGEKETDFINIVAWRALAENSSKYLYKGDKAAVVGTLQTRSYETEDGSKKFVTEVVANEVEFVNTKKTNQEELEPIDDDSLPF